MQHTFSLSFLPAPTSLLTGIWNAAFWSDLSFHLLFRSDLEMQGILNSFGGQECNKIVKKRIASSVWGIASVIFSFSSFFFPADITKTLTAKRKRIQTFTQASLKASSRKFDEVWHTQQRERWEKRNLFFWLDTVKVEDRLSLKDFALNIRLFTWLAFHDNECCITDSCYLSCLPEGVTTMNSASNSWTL